ncbi:MAG: inositol monophosphatase [Actinobacteria bacterium]|nr:inositol monophosphatase [Actinomycetota bacterium]
MSSIWDTRTMGVMRSETAVAISAIEAALNLSHAREGAEDVTHKSERDIVTATDVLIEDRIRAFLGESLEATVVGEERGGEGGSESYWLVDPICGTRNFASGIPLYCINLALVENGLVTVSAIGDGSTGEVLVAQQGSGAWALTDASARQLRVSSDSKTMIIEDGHSTGARREQAANFLAAAIRLDRWELRTFSTTLSLAYVASGRVAAYSLFSISAVHAAAGSLLASESGAFLTDLKGNPWMIESDSLIASADRALHDELLQLARDAEPVLTNNM